MDEMKKDEMKNDEMKRHEYPFYSETNKNEVEYREQQINEGNIPNYNFWAEQVPGNQSYSRYNPETNTWEYNHYDMKQDEPKKKKYSALKFLLKAVCFSAIAAMTFFAIQDIYYAINPDAAPNNNFLNKNLSTNMETPIESTSPGMVKSTSHTVISNVVDNTMPAIVSIQSTFTTTNIWFGREYSQENEGSGSGIIVGRNEDELLIATNNHVVAGASKINVTFIDGKVAEAIIKGTDATADLAVITVDIATLETDTRDTIKMAKLGNSDDIKVGEMAIAIGNALGYGQSVTVGYISAKDRQVNVSDGYSNNTMVLLQTDAAINPGNSGGALLNLEGEVIGINSLKYSSSVVEGMGYAIPITRANPIINELMNREILKEHEQGYLGIAGDDVTEDVAERYKIPIGVYINEVMENGAAAKAGLIQGDIITAINEIEITNITQLREKVTSIRVGTEVKITYMRSVNGTYVKNTITVTLGEKPARNQSTQEE